MSALRWVISCEMSLVLIVGCGFSGAISRRPSRPYKSAFSRPYLEAPFQGHIEAPFQGHLEASFRGYVKAASWGHIEAAFKAI